MEVRGCIISMKLYRKIPLLICCAALLMAFYIKRQQYPFIESMSLKFSDAFQIYQPRDYTDLPVKIVDIDDDTLDKLGQWPWPRAKLADLVMRLQNLGAAAIVFDIVF